MPVIVFLHGGAFVVGSCEAMLYGPQVLLDREVKA
jgi:carboxylesterase type B